MDVVNVERKGGVRWISLRAGKRNALDLEAVEALTDALAPDESTTPETIERGIEDGGLLLYHRDDGRRLRSNWIQPTLKNLNMIWKGGKFV